MREAGGAHLCAWTITTFYAQKTNTVTSPAHKWRRLNVSGASIKKDVWWRFLNGTFQNPLPFDRHHSLLLFFFSSKTLFFLLLFHTHAHSILSISFLLHSSSKSTSNTPQSPTSLLLNLSNPKRTQQKTTVHSASIIDIHNTTTTTQAIPGTDHGRGKFPSILLYSSQEAHNHRSYSYTHISITNTRTKPFYCY